MTVYLVDEPNVEVAVAYASLDNEANFVLLQDAVYSASKVSALGRVYVLESDITRRGLNSKIPQSVNIISYDQLVKMMKSEKVINFL